MELFKKRNLLKGQYLASYEHKNTYLTKYLTAWSKDSLNCYKCPSELYFRLL